MTEHAATHHCREPHRLAGPDQSRNAGRTRLVLILTIVTMVAEIVAGTLFGSMALLADGWHMASHAAVLGIAVFAYAYAKRHAANAAYTFGTGKVGDLAAFTSAVLLGVVALLMAIESGIRFANPVSIAFDEAIVVAAIGLTVNIASAWLLHEGGQHHDHSHAHPHGEHRHHHHDHNLRAAYVHVLADALTSVLAIAALVAGLVLGWTWMDPAMGILGAILIGRWSIGLMQGAGRVLLDATPTAETENAVRDAIEQDGESKIADLHVWRIAPGQLAAVITIVTPTPHTAAHYKGLLTAIAGLSHTTIEVEKI